METPLLNALLEHIRQRPAPFHMPGHKGRMEDFESMALISALDVTELPDTGDLYVGVDPQTGLPDPIAQAQDLWARAWGYPICQFLTGGSTQGVHAALLLAGRDKGVTLVDRCSHRSVYNALAMWDCFPVYLMRRQDQPLSPALLKAAFRAMEDHGKHVTTVCITSPTYYGVLSDIPALAEIAHDKGAKLIVDAAHGCHLPFMMEPNPFRGADLVVTSAHKTLPAYGQGALLFSNEGFTPRDLRWAASVCGTSSPSYPIMASMDWARARMEDEGTVRALHAAAETVKAFRRTYRGMRGKGLDPLRLTLNVNAVAAQGEEVKEYLERMGVFPEMADRDHVVFLFSSETVQEDVDRLDRRLMEAQRAWPGLFAPPVEPPLPPEPDVCMSPAQALTAPSLLRPLNKSEGFICLEQVAPYPPGVPVIAPGERVTKKGLAYLRDIGYNTTREIAVLNEIFWSWEEGRPC